MSLKFQVKTINRKNPNKFNNKKYVDFKYPSTVIIFF